MTPKRDWTKETTPAFTAVEDIKSWIGRKDWPAVSKHMARASACAACFTENAEALGVTGYPIEAWYELYQGGTTYKDDLVEAKARHETTFKENSEALDNWLNQLFAGIFEVSTRRPH